MTKKRKDDVVDDAVDDASYDDDHGSSKVKKKKVADDGSSHAKKKKVADDGTSHAKKKKGKEVATDGKGKEVATDAGSGDGKEKKGKPYALGIILKKAEERERFDILAGRGLLMSRYPDKTTLDDLGMRENVRDLVGNIGWGKFIGHSYSTKVYLTLEFLSTLCFRKDKDNVDDPQHNNVSFSLDNREFSMSLTEFCERMGFASTGLIHDSHNPNNKPENYDPDEFWHQITGMRKFVPKSAKASSIHNPVFRYIHRVMACSIFGRKETGTVRTDELFILWAMVNKQQVNTGYYLLSHMASVATQDSGKIVVGGPIEFMAKTLNIKLYRDEHPLHGCNGINIDTLIQMKMIKDVSGGKREQFQLRVANHDSFLLPNPDRTDTSNVENWIYSDLGTEVPAEQHDGDDVHADDQEEDQPLPEVQHDHDWRARIEAEVQGTRADLQQMRMEHQRHYEEEQEWRGMMMAEVQQMRQDNQTQQHMLNLMMQHLKIEYQPPGGV